MQHLIDYFGGVENLKGKKLVMSWAYSPSYGKPLSVPQAVIALMTRYGMDVVLAHPEGYELLPEIVEIARKNAAANGSHFSVSHDMREAFKGADVVYPKSWASIPLMQERIALLRKGAASKDALKELDARGIAASKKFIDWQCTDELMKLTKDGKALYCHCLPADITSVSCERGEVPDSDLQGGGPQAVRDRSHDRALPLPQRTHHPPPDHRSQCPSRVHSLRRRRDLTRTRFRRGSPRSRQTTANSSSSKQQTAATKAR
jgi:ornithine carbamoyltransferase